MKTFPTLRQVSVLVTVSNCRPGIRSFGPAQTFLIEDDEDGIGRCLSGWKSGLAPCHVIIEDMKLGSPKKAVAQALNQLSFGR